MQCSDMPLSETAEFVGNKDEWPDDLMLKSMQVHYPDIRLPDIVQVVEHLNPEESLLKIKS